MNQPLLGIHHITALAGDAQRNLDFYVRVLGLRFVKRSINQDAPDVYHLYYGDEIGSPGTAMTFFPFGRASRGRKGNGEIGRVAFGVPAGSMGFWAEQLAKHGVPFDGPVDRFGEPVISFPDPDGLLVELVFSDRLRAKHPWRSGPVPPEHAVRGFHGVTMYVEQLAATAEALTDRLGFTKEGESGPRHRYVIGAGADRAAVDVIADASLPPAGPSAGSVHHIAWRVADDEAHRAWHGHVSRNGFQASDIVDRFYFRSIYFREPGGVLYEIATDGPGFTVDEPPGSLGSTLVLPPWYEPHRTRIERVLPPITVPV